MKTIADVKGKRVTGEYPAHLAVWFSVFGSLSTGGLTWDDVKVVPVPAVNEGIDALVQGRADVSNHTIGFGKVKEADAAVGVRFVSLDCSPQGEARIKKAVPGYYLIDAQSRHVHRHRRTTPACTPTTCTSSVTKRCRTSTSCAALKAIWDNVDKLPQFHPGSQNGPARAPSIPT